MYRLLVYLSILQSLHCNCPTGFQLVSEGQCRSYWRGTFMTPMEAFDAANDKCKQFGAQPVTIHNKEQDDYWRSRINTSTRDVLILGLKCSTATNKWEWLDGTPMDYKPIDSNDLFSGPCNTGCSFTEVAVLKLFGWEKFVCIPFEFEGFAIGCTKQLMPPMTNEKGCNGFSEDSADGVCYKVFTSAENYSDAAAKCQASGAKLASIHNLPENEFVRKLAMTKGAANGLFLGARFISHGLKMNFRWNDGSAWNYTNWHHGLPGMGLGECLAMDTVSDLGQWVNTDCSAKMAFACTRKIGSSAPVCESGPWKEGQIITSPGFPGDSPTPCEYILTVAANKRVKVELQLLEANSCCDRLILLDNIVGGNVIANLTGEITAKPTYTTRTSNVMRVSWQPNGAVNVQGFQMKYYAV